MYISIYVSIHPFMHRSIYVCVWYVCVCVGLYMNLSIYLSLSIYIKDQIEQVNRANVQHAPTGTSEDHQLFTMIYH